MLAALKSWKNEELGVFIYHQWGTYDYNGTDLKGKKIGKTLILW